MFELIQHRIKIFVFSKLKSTQTEKNPTQYLEIKTLVHENKTLNK